MSETDIAWHFRVDDVPACDGDEPGHRVLCLICGFDWIGFRAQTPRWCADHYQHCIIENPLEEEEWP